MASNTASSATCELCSELFTEPRMLPCLHSFCKKCLQKLLDEHGTDSTLKCPTCEKSACVPVEGVNGFPQDLRRSYEAEIAQYEAKVKSSSDQSCDRCIKLENGPAVCFCCNCCDFLCKMCKEDHQIWRKTLSHELVDVGEDTAKKTEGNVLTNIPHKPMFCALHDDENLKFFCETCQTLICRDCIILEHAGHKYNRFEKVAEKEKNDLLSVLDDAEAAKTKIESAMAQGEKTMQCLQLEKKSVEESITTTFKGLHDVLHSHEVALLDKSEEISLRKAASLSLQQEELKKIRDKIANVYQMVLTAVQTYSLAEMLSTKRTMKERLQDLLKQFSECQLDPRENEMMRAYLQASPLCSAITSFGAVTGGCCPSTTTASLYIPRMIVGKERRVVITARDENGKPFPHYGEGVNAEISLMGSRNLPIKAKVTDNRNGTYNVCFTSQTQGDHELAIAISSYPIKGSPFIISARQERDYTSLFQSRWKQCFSTSGQPWDVAIDGNGDIFVANFSQHYICVFDKNGSAKQTISQFSHPSAIAIQGNLLYVAEHGKNCIQKLRTTGEFISRFGSSSVTIQGIGRVSSPRGICLDSYGKVFVSGYSSNQVCVYNTDGTYAYNITGNASDGSRLTNPWGVAFDPAGNLHVANYSSPCVKVFTPDGKYITQYGSGQMASAAGITIDEEGYSFVTEYNSRVLVFDPQHQLLTSYQGFQYPAGICFDKEGFLYVADSHNNQVKKY